MKTRLIQTENNQHVVAIDNGTELRAYFTNHSLHAACNAQQALEHDACRFGVDVGVQGGFENLPIIQVRIARSGRRMYSVAGE